MLKLATADIAAKTVKTRQMVRTLALAITTIAKRAGIKAGLNPIER